MSKVTVTEKVFNAVKILVQGGATIAECKEYMGISPATVGIIKKSGNYEEYKNNMRLNSGSTWKKKQREKEKKETSVDADVKKAYAQPVSVTVQATHYMMEELRQTNEYLKLISNKLAFIVDELTGCKGVTKDG